MITHALYAFVVVVLGAVFIGPPTNRNPFAPLVKTSVLLLVSGLFLRDQWPMLLIVWGLNFVQCVWIVSRVIMMEMELIPSPLKPGEDDKSSWYQLLDEPDLTADQLWFYCSDRKANGEVDRHSGVVVADSEDQLVQWLKDRERVPTVYLNGTDAAKHLAEFKPHFWQIRKQIERIRLKGWNNRIQRVLRLNGNGGSGDARWPETYDSPRLEQLAQERAGVELYWRAHAGLTPATDPTPRDEWITEIRAIGRAWRDKDKERMDAILARPKVARVAPIGVTP